MLDHEKLDVYQCSIDFLAFAFSAAGCLPRGYAGLGDQLRRAAMSVPLNIAEGAGKMTTADKANFYSIARGSAMECGAILDVIRILSKKSDSEFLKAKELLERVVAMLSKMCGVGSKSNH
jgi:four helix bundle protein